MQLITIVAAAAGLVVAWPTWTVGSASATERSAPVVETLELVPVAGFPLTFEVYGAISNASAREVRLVAVAGNGILSVANVMGRHRLPRVSLSPDPSITVPPNSEMLFLERGLHLVATTDPSADRTGSVVMELTFDDGTTRSFDAPILPAGSPPTDHHHEP